MTEHDIRNPLMTIVKGGSSFAHTVDGPRKTGSNRTCTIKCPYQAKPEGLNLPKSRWFEYDGSEDYAWYFADKVYHITPGDICKCNYVKRGDLDFSRWNDLEIEVTSVEVDYDNFVMYVEGKMP